MNDHDQTTEVCSWDGERNCPAEWHWDDGVPYCDRCGLYRQSIHRQMKAINDAKPWGPGD